MSGLSTAPSTSTSLRFAAILTISCGFLDAYTFICRGGVFANAQTGNVIFFAIKASEGRWGAAMDHVWPILAFVVGVLAAAHIKAGRLDGLLRYPIRVTLGLQAFILLAVGFVPATVPAFAVIIPVTFVAAMQIELFRTVGTLGYVSVATTGNLMRIAEAGYDLAVTRTKEARQAFGVYAVIIGAFAGGAVLGAVSTQWVGVHAAWIPSALLAVTLALFVYDDRRAATQS